MPILFSKTTHLFLINVIFAEKENEDFVSYIMIIMEIFILIGVIIAIVFWYSDKKRNVRKNFHSRQGFNQSIIPEIDNINDNITFSKTEESDINSQDQINVGEIIETENNEYIINPLIDFHLTLYNCNREDVVKVRDILDRILSGQFWEYRHQLKYLIAIKNIKCKEIEEYINNFGEKYKKKIEELIERSIEWPNLSEFDKKDLLKEFEIKAMEYIDIIPHKNAKHLIAHKGIDLTKYEKIIYKYGYQDFEFYLSQIESSKKVKEIDIESKFRKPYEKLVELGLAKRGKDIPIEEIIDLFTMKEITEIFKDRTIKKFAKKNEAIQFFVNQYDAIAILERKFSFRKLFKIIELPKEFVNVDLDELKIAFEYLGIYFEILMTTYKQAYYSHRNKIIFTDPNNFYDVKNWKILSWNDLCPCCNNSVELTYSINDYPKLPHHIGCECKVNPV